LKRILFFLNHPAHYHLFKHTIDELKAIGHEIHIVIKSKDILEDLLEAANESYTNFVPQIRKDGYVAIINGLLKRNRALYSYCKNNPPDIMVGTSTAIAHIGALLGIPTINFSEDDYKVVRNFGLVTYPFTDVILSPITCENGKWNKKTVFYSGYHKLAYLHPNRFKPDLNIVQKYISTAEPYFILRFSKLNAYHDTGIDGITDEIAQEIIKLLTAYGKVYITSERELPSAFEQYRLQINPLDIHHILAHADLYIGDSQSMTVESALLGTPAIRFSSFVGQIGVLEELENKYNLTFGIAPHERGKLFIKIQELLQESSKKKFRERRERMLQDKIDVAAFFTWFIDNYPNSREKMREKPDFEKTFLAGEEVS